MRPTKRSKRNQEAFNQEKYQQLSLLHAATLSELVDETIDITIFFEQNSEKNYLMGSHIAHCEYTCVHVGWYITSRPRELILEQDVSSTWFWNEFQFLQLERFLFDENIVVLQ